MIFFSHLLSVWNYILVSLFQRQGAESEGGSRSPLMCVDAIKNSVVGIIFLGLSLSSFMTIFITRTKKFFFSRMPGLLLLVSVLIVSTL